MGQNVKVAHQEIKCPTERISETATAVTFPNIANTGDCMGDALRGQKKDVSKFTISSTVASNARVQRFDGLQFDCGHDSKMCSIWMYVIVVQISPACCTYNTLCMCDML